MRYTAKIFFVCLGIMIIAMSGCAPNHGGQYADGVQELVFPEGSEGGAISCLTLGPVQISLPWRTTCWQHFFKNGFSLEVPSLSGAVVCVNAYAGRQLGSNGYYDMLCDLIHRGGRFPGNEAERLALRKRIFGSGTVWHFEDANRKGFVFQKVPGKFVVMSFSVNTPDGLQITLRSKKGSPSQWNLARAQLLASSIRFLPGRECLNREEFAARILRVNQSGHDARAPQDTETKVEQQRHLQNPGWR